MNGTNILNATANVSSTVSKASTYRADFSVSIQRGEEAAALKCSSPKQHDVRKSENIWFVAWVSKSLAAVIQNYNDSEEFLSFRLFNITRFRKFTCCWTLFAMNDLILIPVKKCEECRRCFLRRSAEQSYCSCYYIRMCFFCGWESKCTCFYQSSSMSH